MNSLDRILARRRALSMDIETWDMYRTTPNWVRERMLGVNHFRHDAGQFQIAEVILSEAIGEGAVRNHLLSLLVESGAERPLEMDMGFGKYRRPNQPGNLVFTSMNPGSRMAGKGPFHSITFYITPERLHERSRRLLDGGEPSFHVLHSKHFRDEAVEVLMKRLVHQFQREPIAGQQMTSDDLVDDIIRRLLVLSDSRLPESSVDDRLTPESVARAIDYMQAHFADDINRDDLARVAGVNAAHFTRLFRQTLGIPPKQYLLKIRIDHVKQLLRYGSQELSLSEIALRCGFFSQSHMGREFRRQVGTTPHLYRVYA